MTDIFDRHYIFLNEDFKNREEAFAFIAKKAVALGFADDETAVKAALDHREAEASTGLQDSIAIPHAITKAIKQPAVLFVRSAHGIPGWETMDDQAVTQIIAMLVPEGSSEQHLQTLSDFSAALIEEKERQALAASKTPDEVYAVLTGQKQN
ncbi:PTS sugar transporter subunit IIA [Lacticaseibacillus jixianensis]|uniref:PTS sugar transporter subunit IIA n=1 Tax=Lacticaseibacillus jixianensis TaxID=2486012 RepID=A0ABW4B5L7_9LACO|nr:PTS sugar transporter subunit IIA [Lacticaseibacillus jixianensis]